MTKTYVGDIDTAIDLDTEIDLTSATLLKIKALKPDGTEVEWTATLSGTTVVRYRTVADDLDQEGTWRLQALVTIGAGTWSGETAKLKVYPEYH